MKTTNISKSINKRFIALVVLMLLSSIGMFGQESAKPAATDFKVEVASDDDQADTQMELVMWIMGTKTQMNAVDNENRISTNGSGKKKYINCGMTPNRILSKTFLKKAMNRDLATA